MRSCLYEAPTELKFGGTMDYIDGSYSARVIQFPAVAVPLQPNPFLAPNGLAGANARAPQAPLHERNPIEQDGADDISSPESNYGSRLERYWGSAGPEAS
jgi:hypothetical protein